MECVGVVATGISLSQDHIFQHDHGLSWFLPPLPPGSLSPRFLDGGSRFNVTVFVIYRFVVVEIHLVFVHVVFHRIEVVGVLAVARFLVLGIVLGGTQLKSGASGIGATLLVAGIVSQWWMRPMMSLTFGLLNILLAPLAALFN